MKVYHQRAISSNQYRVVDWTVQIVSVVKPDKSIRLCQDFKLTVNKASKLDQYPIYCFED